MDTDRHGRMVCERKLTGILTDGGGGNLKER